MKKEVRVWSRDLNDILLIHESYTTAFQEEKSLYHTSTSDVLNTLSLPQKLRQVNQFRHQPFIKSNQPACVVDFWDGLIFGKSSGLTFFF